MSTVNYSLNHRGVRLIGASEAWIKGKNRRVETSYPHFRYYRKSRHPA